MTWQVHVTVAAVVPDQDRFLMVYETTERGPAFNQPAGHLEAGETLIQAVVRETMEETGWRVRPTGLLALNQYEAANGHTYLRTSFIAEPLEQLSPHPLDSDIIEALWLSYPEIVARRDSLRSPMVLSDIERWQAGVCYPLELLARAEVQ